MARQGKEEKVVRQIVKRYGKVIDLERNPGVIIDIIRSFGHEVLSDDDGGLPGGVPPSPPPGPTSFQDPVTNSEIMKELLRLSRAVDRIARELRS